MRVQCAVCPVEFEAVRRSAKYCSPRCRSAAFQERQRSGVPSPRSPRPPGRGSGGVSAPLAGVGDATAAVLAAAGRTETPSGQSALALADRIDAAEHESGSALASLAREHRACLADALRDADRAATDPLDELRAARERRAAG